MDLAISDWIVNTFGSNAGFAKFWKVITYSSSAITIVLIIILLLVFKKTRMIGMYAMLTCLITVLFSDIILKMIFERPRPFVEDSKYLIMCNIAEYKLPTGYSLPSSHSAISMALAVSILLCNKKGGIVACIWSVLVGFSRMILCVHYFTDVLVGYLVGAIIAIAVHKLINYSYKKLKLRREIKNG